MKKDAELVKLSYSKWLTTMLDLAWDFDYSEFDRLVIMPNVNG